MFKTTFIFFLKKAIFICFLNYGGQDANLNLSLIDVANLILQSRKVQLNIKKKKRKHSSSNSKDKIGKPQTRKQEGTTQHKEEEKKTHLI